MNTIRLSILFLLLSFLFCGTMPGQAQSQAQPQEVQLQKASFPSGDAIKNSTITYQVISGINDTWGYDILVDQKLKIHQPSVPGLPGNDGFKTKERAEKVAKLVIDKMKKGEMPPAITVEEMKKLNVI
jgi:hypothetical protein